MGIGEREVWELAGGRYEMAGGVGILIREDKHLTTGLLQTSAYGMLRGLVL